MYSACALKSSLIIKHEVCRILLLTDQKCRVLTVSNILAKVSDSYNLSTVRVYIVELCSLHSVKACEISRSYLSTCCVLCFILITSSVSKENLEVIYDYSVSCLDLVTCKALCHNDILKGNLYSLKAVNLRSSLLLVARCKCQYCYESSQHQFRKFHNCNS